MTKKEQKRILKEQQRKQLIEQFLSLNVQCYCRLSIYGTRFQ